MDHRILDETSIVGSSYPSGKCCPEVGVNIGLPKRLKRDTFPVIPEFRYPLGGLMLRNLPFRIALTSALALNLAAGPAILSAQQIPSEIPDITIRTSTRLVVVDVVVRDK